MYTVIGCGNLNRSDDGVGVVVARRLVARCAPWGGRVRVFDAGTGGMEVMFQARGVRRLVIVDACRSGDAPGTVFCVPGTVLQQDYAPSVSLHDFRWDHALAVGRRIFRDDFPDDVAVYLVEAASLALGLELSAVVERTARRVEDAIVADIQARYGAPRPAEVSA